MTATESAAAGKSTAVLTDGSTAIGPRREAMASADVSVVLRQEHVFDSGDFGDFGVAG